MFWCFKVKILICFENLTNFESLKLNILVFSDKKCQKFVGLGQHFGHFKLKQRHNFDFKVKISQILCFLRS